MGQQGHEGCYLKTKTERKRHIQGEFRDSELSQKIIETVLAYGDKCLDLKLIILSI